MSETQSAPIILVHGIFGFNQLTLGGLKVTDYFRLIPDALRRDGCVVPEPPQLNPAGSVAERAQDLKNYLQDENRGDVFRKQVHIIAHSMGNRAVLRAATRIAARVQQRSTKPFGQAILAAADVDAEVSIWKGCLHGWVPSDMPVHNPDGAERHWRALIELFDGALKT